jgi:hypothetical protein
MTQFVRGAILTIALALLTLTHAQTFQTFTTGLFSGLEATELECTTMGVNARDFDFSRCGAIFDNLINVNKRIIERRFSNAGYAMLIPWSTDREEGINQHKAGFAPLTGSGGLLYIVVYYEEGGNVSLIWVVANRR